MAKSLTYAESAGPAMLPPIPETPKATTTPTNECADIANPAAVSAAPSRRRAVR